MGEKWTMYGKLNYYIILFFGKIYDYRFFRLLMISCVVIVRLFLRTLRLEPLVVEARDVERTFREDSEPFKVVRCQDRQRRSREYERCDRGRVTLLLCSADFDHKKHQKHREHRLCHDTHDHASVVRGLRAVSQPVERRLGV